MNGFISLSDRKTAPRGGDSVVNSRFIATNPFRKQQEEILAREARMRKYVADPHLALREVHWVSPICGLTPLPECDECGFQDDEDGSIQPCDGQAVISLDVAGIFRFEERTYGRCPDCRRGMVVHLPFVPEDIKALRRQCLAWIQEIKSEEPVDTQAGFEATLKAAIKTGRGLQSVEWDGSTYLRIDHEGRLRQVSSEGEGTPALLTAEALLQRWQLI